VSRKINAPIILVSSPALFSPFLHANADEIIAFPDPNLEAAVRRAIDKPAGFFARHLPDSCAGQVVLAGLDPSTIPPEMQGVWWYDALAGNYKF